MTASMMMGKRRYHKKKMRPSTTGKRREGAGELSRGSRKHKVQFTQCARKKDVRKISQAGEIGRTGRQEERKRNAKKKS